MMSSTPSCFKVRLFTTGCRMRRADACHMPVHHYLFSLLGVMYPIVPNVFYCSYCFLLLLMLITVPTFLLTDEIVQPSCDARTATSHKPSAFKLDITPNFCRPCSAESSRPITADYSRPDPKHHR